MEQGKLFILSGPSGVGKNAVEKELRQQLPNMKRVVTYTTRPPRPSETNGIHYNFVNEETFSRMINDGDFLEWAQVHDYHYGTSNAAVNNITNQSLDVLAIIDVQGAIQVKQQKPDAILIFLKPESIEQLKSHIISRGDVSEEQLALRLKNAENELNSQDKYDFVVTNIEGNLQKTVESVKNIILEAKQLTK